MPLPTPRPFHEYANPAEEIRDMAKQAISEALEKRGWKINFPLDVFVHHVGTFDFQIYVDLSLKGE